MRSFGRISRGRAGKHRVSPPPYMYNRVKFFLSDVRSVPAESIHDRPRQPAARNSAFAFRNNPTWAEYVNHSSIFSRMSVELRANTTAFERGPRAKYGYRDSFPSICYREITCLAVWELIVASTANRWRVLRNNQFLLGIVQVSVNEISGFRDMTSIRFSIGTSLSTAYS